MREVISMFRPCVRVDLCNGSINIAYEGSAKANSIIAGNVSAITSEVLADSVSEGTNAGYKKEWNINGETVTLYVEKQ